MPPTDTPLSFHDLRPDPKERLDHIQHHRHPIALLLDSVTDPRNLGLLFRLADAAALERIFLWQVPEAEPTAKVQRISRSTVSYVPHEHLKTQTALKATLRKYQVLALEYTQQSVEYTRFQPGTTPLLIVVGNEQQGVSPLLLQHCPQKLHLPMFGMNTSMNVACAASILVYHLLQTITKR